MREVIFGSDSLFYSLCIAGAKLYSGGQTAGGVVCVCVLRELTGGSCGLDKGNHIKGTAHSGSEDRIGLIAD